MFRTCYNYENFLILKCFTVLFTFVFFAQLDFTTYDKLSTGRKEKQLRVGLFRELGFTRTGRTQKLGGPQLLPTVVLTCSIVTSLIANVGRMIGKDEVRKINGFRNYKGLAKLLIAHILPCKLV